jgi:hypothetical protein
MTSASTPAEAIANYIACMSTTLNTYQLPINAVYFGLAIAFPHSSSFWLGQKPL